MNIQFGILPANAREEKSREQAAYQLAARNDPALIRRGQIFKDVCKDHVVKIVRDPRLDNHDEMNYGY